MVEGRGWLRYWVGALSDKKEECQTICQTNGENLSDKRAKFRELKGEFDVREGPGAGDSSPADMGKCELCKTWNRDLWYVYDEEYGDDRLVCINCMKGQWGKGWKDFVRTLKKWAQVDVGVSTESTFRGPTGGFGKEDVEYCGKCGLTVESASKKKGLCIKCSKKMKK